MSTYGGGARKNPTRSRDSQRIWFYFNMQVKKNKKPQTHVISRGRRERKLMRQRKRKWRRWDPSPFPGSLKKKVRLTCARTRGRRDFMAIISHDWSTYLPRGGSLLTEFAGWQIPMMKQESRSRKIKTFKVKRFCTCRPVLSAEHNLIWGLYSSNW